MKRAWPAGTAMHARYGCKDLQRRGSRIPSPINRDNCDMRIAEIYRSVQGEGLLTGVPSVFVRTSGCNLRCWFCDTPYTSWRPEGQDMTVDDIIAQVEEWDTRHVVITGGEPMLYSELIPLCARLKAISRHVTIETAGTLYLP